MSEEKKQTKETGLIGLFVRHPTAHNLLMILIVLFGIYSITKLNTQFFPTIEVPRINITVNWSGASAADVEKNILDALEPELRFLDNVEEVTSYAREGAGTISIAFYSGTDMQKALSDAEQAVSKVTTLPEDAEEPVIQRLTFFENVAKISVSGPFSEEAIKAYAKQIREGLLNAGIDQVDFTGKRDQEIWVLIKEYDLQRLGLSLADVATRIKDNSRDLPSGTIEGEVEVQLRSLAERKTPEELGQIEVKSLKTGEKVLLRDIALLENAFDKDQKTGYKNGTPAIELQVKRPVSADTLKTMETMTSYIDKIRPTLPQTLNVEIYKIQGKLVKQRLWILVENGIQGLVLVLLMLFIFLNARIAFWVAMGIPISLLGALSVMYLSGQSINMMSMFALIMMLGIIVDDAIVVGEHAATREEMGDSEAQAAETGAIRMLAPVLAATLTTMAAFLPIFLITGRIGDIFSAIPLVVIAVLIASTIECFLILPGHLRHRYGKRREPHWLRQKFDAGFNGFKEGAYARFVRFTYHWRYATLAFSLSLLIIAFGLVAGGRTKFNFFPSPEPESFSVQVMFAAGLPKDEKTKAMKQIGEAIFIAEKALLSGGSSDVSSQVKSAHDPERAYKRREPKPNNPDQKLIVTSFAVLGQAGQAQGENMAEIDVELTPSEERVTTARDIVRMVRQKMPKLPGIEEIAVIPARGGPPGRDLDIRLQGATADVLKAAAQELKNQMQSLPGVSAISDDLPFGKPELIMELTPRGAALGFTSEMVGVQVRNSFEGAIANRFAREDEEITVRVKRLQEEPGVYALQKLFLRAPDGQRVPLAEVVTLREKQGFSVIQRRDGLRTVAVTADVDANVVSQMEVVAKLSQDILPVLSEKYGFQYVFKGRSEDQANSFKDLTLGIYLALAMIYIILAWVFGSYTNPLAVMTIIPFGIAGAIFGHVITGYDLTVVTMVGLLGLSGILVNDAIVLVDESNHRKAAGETIEDAAVGASQDRLRAVLLTSLTTIGGLFPLIFETSRQAQFLIPMAVTFVFGLALATFLVLFMVPVMLGIGDDLYKAGKWLLRLYVPATDKAAEDDSKSKPVSSSKG